LHALVSGLAFAPAPPQNGLASLVSSNSPDHNAKGTQSDTAEPKSCSRPPTACKHIVSGSLSLPAQGCFSPVPHGTRSLSVTRESLALEGGPPRFTPDPTCRALLRKSTTGSALSSRTGLSPSLAPHSRGLRLTSLPASVAPTTPIPQGDRFRLGPVRSPLLRASQLISLPLGTEMFQFPRFASRLRGMTAQNAAGFPHSAIQGSMRVCRSPWLIAAYHGLHRLRVPRHPRYAFIRLTTNSVLTKHARFYHE
jgi:hypothetical protein